MSYFELLLLYCLQQINGERTIYSIFHLFKGKKSSQTIQDAHLFKLTKFFGVCNWITRQFLEEVIKHASNQNWIEASDEHKFVLTEKGMALLQQNGDMNSDLPFLDGWMYHQKDLKFWERLSLLVQVISNLIRHETHYMPIQKNKETHQWLKAFLMKNEMPRNLLGSTLYSELVDCLENDHHLNPSVLTIRLTGFNRIGLTENQAAEILKMDITRYQLEFLNILHYLIGQVSSPLSRFPLVHAIAGTIHQQQSLTKSAQQTYLLVSQGFSIEEAARFRHLKKNTIEDHIVEMALNVAEFSIDHYIDQHLQQKILAAARKADSKQLKQIRSRVSEANYFEIRLVLAKYGVMQCN